MILSSDQTNDRLTNVAVDGYLVTYLFIFSNRSLAFGIYRQQQQLAANTTVVQ